VIRALFIAVNLAAAPVVTTARPTPDAGVPLTTVELSADGGVIKVSGPHHDARVDTSEVARLRSEVSALTQRVGTLEQTIEREHQQNEQLRKVAAQLQALHDEQAAVLDAKQKSERAAADRTAQVRVAVNGLVAAVHQLQTGDSNIGWAIDAAQGAPVGPNAQKNLELARSALYNEDLNVAGNYLVHAIAEAQAFDGH
jgi:TolA-binding protein